MKTLRLSSITLTFTAALALSVIAARPVPPAKPAAPPALSFDTNTIPQSVFVIPDTAGTARDPFFPTRIIQAHAAVAASTNTTPVNTGAGCLVLKGLSGTPSNPFAMINGRTMARGEDAEINTACGRLLVHCVDITTNGAIIEVGGERRELRLRDNF